MKTKLLSLALPFFLVNCSAPNYSSKNQLGISDVSKGIFGGEIVENYELESQYLFRLKVSKMTGDDTYCTAVKVQEGVYITTAHCVSRPMKKEAWKESQNLQVELDEETKKYFISDSSRNMNIEIKRVDVHPKYLKVTNLASNGEFLPYENDIAILFSEERIKFDGGKVLNPTQVKLLIDFSEFDQHNSQYFAFGFGSDSYDIVDGHAKPDQALQKADHLTLLSIENQYLVFSQNQGEGICVGDSGGALIGKGEDGALQLLGLATSVSNKNSSRICEGKSYFLRIKEFKPWIQSRIRLNFLNKQMKELSSIKQEMNIQSKGFPLSLPLQAPVE